jgi:hypothetical protein
LTHLKKKLIYDCLFGNHAEPKCVKNKIDQILKYFK